MPWLSSFPELNLRTYVRLENRPGVFFFSLDAGNPVAVSLARRSFFLPYFRARMTCSPQGDGVVYRSERVHAGEPRRPLFEGHYGPVGDPFHAVPGTLEHFLTERYCLYASGDSTRPSAAHPYRRGDLYRAEVHHGLGHSSGRSDHRVNSVLESVGDRGRRPEQAPHLLFARSLDVRVWPLRKI